MIKKKREKTTIRATPTGFAYLFCIGKKKGTETKHPTTSLNCSARHLLRNTPRPVRFLYRAGRIRHPLVEHTQALLPRAQRCAGGEEAGPHVSVSRGDLKSGK